MLIHYSTDEVPSWDSIFAPKSDSLEGIIIVSRYIHQYNGYGEHGGNRTHDTRIKSPVLFRLSYASMWGKLFAPYRSKTAGFTSKEAWL